MDTRLISPTTLVIGDVIVDNGPVEKQLTRVTELELCSAFRKGRGRIHVNCKWCYDSAALVEIVARPT